MLGRVGKLADWRTWLAFGADARWLLYGPCPPPRLSDAAGASSRAIITWPTEYEHPSAARFVRPIEAAFSTIAEIRHAKIPQPHDGIVLIDIDVGDGSRRIALDYFDFTHVNERCAAEADVYFKMQHRREGYGAKMPHVFPAGYVTVSHFLYRHWCRLRALRRSTTPQVDVFGRFGLRSSADVRRRAIELLSAEPRIEFAGGTKTTKHSWYLREMARARVCLDLPGQGPFCCRLVECLAMGCCVIGPRHATILPVALRPEVEIVHCADDLSDLAELCVRYARDPSASAAIGRAAAAYFDQHLHPVRLAAYYVETVREVTQRSRVTAGR
jgi:hypothetical protein